MTIQELINILETMTPTGDVFVHLFKADGTGESFEIDYVSEHNGNAQINISGDYL